MRSTSVSNPYLQHLADEGGGIDEVLPISGRATVFGRSSHADVVLREDSVSRQHAAIVHDSEGRSFLLDLGSATGSYVDKARVASGKTAPLADGAVITLGASANTYTFRVERPPPNANKRKR